MFEPTQNVEVAKLAELQPSTVAVQQRISDLQDKIDNERKSYDETASQMREIKAKADASMEKFSAAREDAAGYDSRIE